MTEIPSYLKGKELGKELEQAKQACLTWDKRLIAVVEWAEREMAKPTLAGQANPTTLFGQPLEDEEPKQANWPIPPGKGGAATEGVGGKLMGNPAAKTQLRLFKVTWKCGYSPHEDYVLASGFDEAVEKVKGERGRQDYGYSATELPNFIQ